MVEIVKAEATLEETLQVKVPKKKNVTATVNATANATADADAKADAKADEEGEPKADEEKKEEAAEEKAEEKAEESAEVKKEGDAAEKKEEPEFELVTKKQTHRVLLVITKGGAAGEIAPYDRKRVRDSTKVLAELTKKDKESRKIAAAKNDLESYIYGTRNKLYEPEFEGASTEKEREELSQALMEAEEWIGGAKDDSATPFTDKLASLQALADPINIRVIEQEERPKALNATKTVLNHTLSLLAKWETERPWLPKEDTDELKKLATDLESWLSDKEAEQEKKAVTENPAFLSKQLYDKIQPIAKLGSSLLKRKKPIEKPEVKKKNATSTNGTDGNGTDTETEAEQEAGQEDTTTGEENTQQEKDAAEEEGSDAEAKGKDKDEL